MVSNATASCFPNIPQNLQMYSEDVAVAGGSETHSGSLLYYLSNLKDKVQQIQSLVSIIISPDHQNQESTSIAIASMGNLIPEIIVSASSMMFTCQQMSLTVTPDGLPHQQHHVKVPDSGLPQHNSGSNNNIIQERSGHGFYSADTMDWYGDQDNHNSCYTNEINNNQSVHQVSNKRPKVVSMKDYDIVELDAADLLAKYTHYCQVCGKGFKRDANLRMHMRAHGDEYKTSAALSNPMKNINANSTDGNMMKLGRKFSCPQEGCRWNKKHAKFQPLKSMICVKNHYKRSHCPKMYVCKRCNQKQFSVLSDLRTHEKHCGDLKWQCSCGTTFSRKDKLMGHVALFIGHTPAINSMTKLSKIELPAAQAQLDDRG